MRVARFAVCSVAVVAGLQPIAQAASPANPPASDPVQRPSRPVNLPPTPADFVGYPSCMLYAAAADTRVRVRAQRIAPVCARLAGELSRLGSRWSRRTRRAPRILSPICRFADPRGQIELEVIDDASGARLGPRICADLARNGWYDLSSS